MIIIFLNAVKV